ncbi:hypothetical protein ACMUMK_10055 [Paraglaciecola sp. 2405UD69-4]
MAFGILSFGNAYIFDRVFLAVLVFTALLCKDNINIVSVVVILFIQAIIGETLWLFWDDTLTFKFIFYIFSLAVLYFCRHDKITRVILAVTILMIITNIFWYITSYNPPNTTWYMWLTISSLGVRFLIFSRVSFVEHYFPKRSESINLDWAIYRLSAFFIFIQVAMILEYWVRHVFSYSDAILMYTIYPYLTQTIATLIIWVVFHESYKLLLPKIMKV